MSSSGHEAPQPFGVQELRAFIREVLSSGEVREIPHSRVDRAYRQVTSDDILRGLEWEGWVLEGNPAFDQKRGRWRYRIATRDCDRDPLILVVSPCLEMRLLEIITKW